MAPSHLLSSTLLVLALAASTHAQSSLENSLTAAGVFALFSDDAAYEEASASFNLRYEFKPIAVTYPTSTEQVAAVVSAGYGENYQVVARSGGHSYVSNGLGGKDGVLVVDLSNMTSISYDGASGYATLETGLRLGDIAFALNDNGRGLPHGSCPSVGIGGHAAGGGFGLTSRMWGLTLDTIQELTVVLANGTVVTASNDENSDLFWAMRGAGSSFGITTSMVVETYPVPDHAIIYSYSWWDVDVETAANAFIAWQEYIVTDIPSELGIEAVLTRGSQAGLVSFSVTGGWYGGSEEALNVLLEPFLSEVPAYSSRTISGDGTYIDTVRVLSGGTTYPNDTFYAKSLMTPESEPMSLEASTAFITYLANQGFTSRTNWFIQLEAFGGGNSKINAPDKIDSSSFGSRNSLLTIQFYTSSSFPPFLEEGFSLLDEMVASITDTMGDDWDYGAYYNYPDDRLSNWQHLYYRAHVDRLVALKDVYDPTGVYRFPLAVE